MDVELSDGIRGAVKGYAEAKNISLSTAYRELLHHGLNHSPYRSSRQSSSVIREGSLDEVYYSSISDLEGLTAYTFDRSFPGWGRDYLWFGGSATKPLNDDFVTTLLQLRPYVSRPERAWFSISNYEGHWYGKGLGNFYTALTEYEQRYEQDYAGKRHKNETAFFLASLGDYGYIGISMQPRFPRDRDWDPEYHPIQKLEVRFLAEGYPLDTSVYEYIAQQFNVDFVSASRVPHQEATVTINEPVEPVTLLLEDDDPPDDEPFVRGAVIPNPLREQPRLRSKFEVTNQGDASSTTSLQQTLYEQASRLEYLPLQLGAAPTERMFSEIILNSITVTEGMGLSCFGHTNIEVAGTDVE